MASTRSKPASTPPAAPSPVGGGSAGVRAAGGTAAGGRRVAATRAGGPPAAPAGRRFLRRRPKAPGRGPGRVAQMRSVYAMTRRADPNVRWWLLLAVAGTLAVVLGIGFLTEHPIYATIIGLPLALLAGLFVLARRAETAAYGQLEGQPGAAGAALRVLRRGWQVEQEPVAVDPRTRDTVFRALGRPGVVLVSDGPPQRVGRLLEAERKRIARVLPDVPIHLLQAGTGAEQVPLAKLPRRVMRLKPALTRAEVSTVSKRLRALGRARIPVPKGMDPMRARPDRRGARGR